MSRKRITLNEEQICNEYLNTKIGVEALALKYHVGKLRIKQKKKKQDYGLLKYEWKKEGAD